MDFEADGDKQCRESNAFFSEELMSFQQFCCSVVGGYQQVQTLFAAELQLSTRFPFPCQERFPRLFKRGSKNEVKKSIRKMTPAGPQMDPKSRPKSLKSIESVSWGGAPKMDVKKVPPSRTRKSEIWQLFTTL